MVSNVKPFSLLIRVFQSSVVGYQFRALSFLSAGVSIFSARLLHRLTKHIEQSYRQLTTDNQQPANIPIPITEKVVLLILACVIICCVIFAGNAYSQGIVDRQDYNTIFFRANNSYREEKYEDAIRDYEKLISSGLRSANIYYNTGNAYLRNGNKGKAILNYERALRERPRDVDIRSNLGFARTLIEDSGGYYGGKWYETVFFFLRGFLSMNEVTIIVSIIYFAIIIFIGLSIYFKAQRKLFYYITIAFLILLVIALPSFIAGIYEAEFQRKAVVMAEEIEVRFEPNDDATVHFKLHEGSVIQITKSQDNWYQIRRYDGKMGWLKGHVFDEI